MNAPHSSKTQNLRDQINKLLVSINKVKTENKKKEQIKWRLLLTTSEFRQPQIHYKLKQK